ncbi:MAG: hypothetical protein Q7U04_05900 [Bacteriovorax sp.]|nr:hypothetical protein [Bacteriovorax sp.]
MGGIVNYASTASTNNQYDINFILNLITRINYIELLKTLSPIGLFSIYLCFKHKENVRIKHNLLRILFISIPYLGIQFIVRDNIGFHYAAFISSLLFAFSVITFKNLDKDVSSKILNSILIISILVSIGNYTKYFNIFFNNDKSCKITHRLSSPILNSIETSNDYSILASGALAPHLISTKRIVYQSKVFSRVQDHYKVLAVNRYGDFYPSTKEDYENLISRCKGKASKIIQDNQEAFIAEGNFTKDCIFK